MAGAGLHQRPAAPEAVYRRPDRSGGGGVAIPTGTAAAIAGRIGEPGMSSEFIEQRRAKIFQCYFEGADPRRLLDQATNSLKHMVDPMSGRPVWRLARSIDPVAGHPGTFMVFHTTTQKVATISYTIGLTLMVQVIGATDQDEFGDGPLMPSTAPLPVGGPMGTRGGGGGRRRGGGRRGYADIPAQATCLFSAHFEGGGWDYGSETYADGGMAAISSRLGQLNRGGRWYMTQGAWQVTPRHFHPIRGALPPPPADALAPPGQGEQPPPPSSLAGRPNPAVQPSQAGAAIGQAIPSAGPGAPITIAPGTYREDVVTEKPLTLVGDGPPGSVRIIRVKGRAVPLSAQSA